MSKLLMALLISGTVTVLSAWADPRDELVGPAFIRANLSPRLVDPPPRLLRVNGMYCLLIL